METFFNTIYVLYKLGNINQLRVHIFKHVCNIHIIFHSSANRLVFTTLVFLIIFHKKNKKNVPLYVIETQHVLYYSESVSIVN